MKKKNKKFKSEGTVNESERLLREEPAPTLDPNHLVTPKRKVSRKKSVWAPAATETNFEEVPVLTICPYCNQKGVTRTHLKKTRKHWYCCCCLPLLLDVFKDVIHSCSKCNKQIAIYNRFHFFKRNDQPGGNKSDEDLVEPIP